MQHRSKSSKSKNQIRVKIPLWTKTIFIYSIILFIFTSNWISYGTTLPNTHLTIFSYLEFLQPPTKPFDFLLPTIIVAYICIFLPFIPSKNWTRVVIKIILLILLFRYSIWRITTLNFEHWVSVTFSLFIYIIETFSLFTFVIYSLQSIWSSAKKRSVDADKYVQDISFGKYITSVDVFIPTCDETEQAIYRTVIGCQAMNYPSKKVYILDGTCRKHIRELADKLGCEYIAHPKNKPNKAENINNALLQTNGELVLMMDAGFIPLKSFLMRTIGFFEKYNIGLVQTRQTFYNSGKDARNSRIEHIARDIASFSGFSQSCRDVFNSVLCCETSYIVRRTALESVSDSTKFLAELPASTKILTLGWQIVHLDEVLSIGESTRTFPGLIKQQVRWRHRNYQIFSAGDTTPIWSKLNFWQKSYFFTLYINNFTVLFRAVFVLSPLLALCLGTSPIIATPVELVYYLVPYLWLMIGSYSWSTKYSASFFWKEVLETILCYPILKSSIVIHNPFKLQYYSNQGKPKTRFTFDKYDLKLAFPRTQKSVCSETKNYNLGCTFGPLVSILFMVGVLCWHLINNHISIWQTVTSSEFGLMLLIVVYNFVMIGIALFASIDQPERRTVNRFPLQTGCRVVVDSRIFIGYTNNLSESGVEITLIDSKWVRDENTGILKFIPSSSGEKLDFPADIEFVKLEFLEQNLSLEAKFLRQRLFKKQHNIALEFTNVSLKENCQLVKMLYCDMTSWKRISS
jgi:cellulose synthase (UDP-forming)